MTTRPARNAAIGAAGPTDPESRPLTLKGLHRAASESGALPFSVPALVFLLFFIWPAWNGKGLAVAIPITLLSIVYGFLFVYASGAALYPWRVRLAWLAGAWGVIALMTPIVGSGIGYMAVYLLIFHATLLRGRIGILAILVVSALGVLAALLGEQSFVLVLTLMGASTAYGMHQAIQSRADRLALAQAEERNAVLAVAAERERIGRDLHDILGHSLTTITVSAQLAKRLVDVDPGAAREQIAEIERISRQSLSDVRATTSGMREVRAAGEIASARSVLQAAGVRAELPTAVPPLGEERSELFGYVIREGVTNVVRHARARSCSIEIGPESVSVRDDGRGIPAEHDGSGLDGLRRRVEEAGGTLTIETGRDGTTLRAALPHGSFHEDAPAMTAEPRLTTGGLR